jgi:hypothetical protein
MEMTNVVGGIAQEDSPSKFSEIGNDNGTSHLHVHTIVRLIVLVEVHLIRFGRSRLFAQGSNHGDDECRRWYCAGGFAIKVFRDW